MTQLSINLCGMLVEGKSVEQDVLFKSLINFSSGGHVMVELRAQHRGPAAARQGCKTFQALPRSGD